MRAPLKKIFIARYVLILEVLGFLIMGAIISGMVFCVFHKIDDDCKVKSDQVTGRIEPVTLANSSYVDAVEVKDGDSVKKGQTVVKVLDDPADVSIMEARQDLEDSRQSLTSASAVAAIPAQVLDSVKVALVSSETIAPVGKPSAIAANIDGIVKGADLGALKGKITTGKIADVHNFRTLRFPVAVGGKNSDRVNINLLGAKDITDWKKLTGVIKSKDAPESGPHRHIWGLANDVEANKTKLKFIGANKTPDDIGKGDVVGVLNGFLRQKDFYMPGVWDEASLNQEAKGLIAKGPASLSESELFRLNRLLLEAAFPEAIKTSENKLQVIKAKVIIPKESLLVNGKEKKQKPDIFELRGKVLTDKDTSGQVIVELDNPPAALADYLQKRLSDTKLPAATMTGGIVVGQIKMFQFLFSKE